MSTPIDPRLNLLSYSSLQTFHSCPRKFQLAKLQSTEDEFQPSAATQKNITFAFGHVVGEGIQSVLSGHSTNEIFFKLFTGWHADLEDIDTKRNKSFYLAVAAIQKFISLRSQGFLKDYELLYYNGKPATELSFRISLTDNFKFRGYVDAVLRNTVTGKIIVLEVKTSSSSNLNAASYRNSSQAVGYSVVLDTICPGITDYDVLYLVYLTKSMEYEQLKFSKTYTQRAAWVQELILDIETIKMYHSAECFPMRGESCFSFYSECEYMNTCGLSTRYLSKEINMIEMEKEYSKEYNIELTLDDLIKGQL